MGDRLGTPGAVGFLRFLKQIYFYSFHTTLASLHCTEVPFQTFYLILTHSWVTTVNEKEKKKCRNMFRLRWIFGLTPCQRPYHVEHTSSRPITEVKQHWARIVLGWETAWELLVLLAFFYFGFVWKLKKYNFFPIDTSVAKQNKNFCGNWGSEEWVCKLWFCGISKTNKIIYTFLSNLKNSHKHSQIGTLVLF